MGTRARVKSLPACTHLPHIGYEVQVEVKVILQRVERLENIGKVKGKGSRRSFLPSDNKMHTECGIHTHQRKFHVTSLLEQHKYFFRFCWTMMQTRFKSFKLYA